ncbi:hypothetical protein ACEQ8H_001729 [Pleosporales sp. CAS-2024a]
MRLNDILAKLIVACTTLASALPTTTTTDITKRAATQHDILKALAGTYTLINTTSAHNGIPIPDASYGSAPVGLLVYTSTGWMSATITATEPASRPNLTFPFRATDSDADWAAIGKHSLACFMGR